MPSSVQRIVGEDTNNGCQWLTRVGLGKLYVFCCFQSQVFIAPMRYQPDRPFHHLNF